MKRIDYAIFQLREDMEDNIPIRFANYSSLEKMGVMPTIDRYQEVYRGTLTELEDARSDDTLEKLCLRKIAKVLEYAAGGIKEQWKINPDA